MANDNVSAILGLKGGSGGGGSVTVDSALSLSSTNPVQNKIITHEINEITNTLSAYGTEISGKEDAPTTVTVSGATPTIAAADNTIYEYGELISLTVTAIDATGDFIIRFTSGATATTTSFPVSMKFPEAFAAAANTRYEINVSNGYALAVGWPTT